jgi:hypothetical protein
MTTEEKISEIRSAFANIKALNKKYPGAIKAFTTAENKIFTGFVDIDSLSAWVDLDLLSENILPLENNS